MEQKTDFHQKIAKEETSLFHFITNEPLDNLLKKLDTQSYLRIEKELDDGYCLYTLNTSFLKNETIKELTKLTDDALVYAVDHGLEILVKESLSYPNGISSECPIDTLVNKAIRQGSLTIFNELIANYFNFLQGHLTTVILTIEQNQIEMLKVLLKKNLQLTRGYFTIPPLAVAAGYGYIDLMNLMLHDTRFNSEDNLKNTLFYAAQKNQVLALQTLQNECTIPMKYYSKALFYAIVEGQLESFNELLQIKGIDPSIEGNTALSLAVEKNHFNMALELLKDERVDPFEPYGAYASPFTSAVSKGDMNFIKLFLKDPRIALHDHQKALSTAVSKGHIPVILLLLEKGLVKLDNDNNSAIREASRYETHQELVTLLLTYSEVDPCANENEALRNASRNGAVSIVRLLLKDERVDPNAQITSLNSAIRSAVSNGQLEILKVFKEEANVDLALYPDLIVILCGNQYGKVDEELEILHYLHNEGRVDLYFQNNIALVNAARWNKLKILEYLVDSMTLDSPKNNTQAICKAITCRHYDITAFLLSRLDLVVTDVIDLLPNLLQGCNNKRYGKIFSSKNEERNNINLLKLLLADSKIVGAKSLDQWKDWLESYKFNDESWDAWKKTWESVIIESHMLALWKKITPFHFFSPPNEWELLPEIKKIIYSKMA